MYLRFAFLTLILFVIVAHAMAQQADDQKKPFELLAAEVEKLTSLDDVTNPEVRREFTRLWIRMRSDLRYLQREKEIEPSAEYRESLKQNHEALKQVFEPDLKIDDKLEVCRAVAKDIEVKKVSFQKDAKVAFGQVKVIALTKNGEIEASGLQVWYVPLAWKKIPEKGKRFDKNSSPTEHKLVPGAYLMWTRVPGQAKSGEKQPISVGEGGLPEQTVDLPAPTEK